MIKRKHGISLARARSEGEDVNPNAYITNVGDCMLVLVLGLLVALVARYNVNLQEVPEDEDKIIGVEVNMDEDEDGAVDDTYEERGRVYYDKESGEYYYVAD